MVVKLAQRRTQNLRVYFILDILLVFLQEAKLKERFQFFPLPSWDSVCSILAEVYNAELSRRKIRGLVLLGCLR